MKDTDVTALGELLVDLTEDGTSRQGNPLFEANPGGAPCNVLAMLTKLGKKTAFIGKVGEDPFGCMLRQTLNRLQIGTEGLVTDGCYPTTLALVHTDAGGDRDFSFYRNPGADEMLYEDEITPELITGSRIFHFGSLSLTHKAARAATKKAVTLAKEDGQLISFDPNYRAPLWADESSAKEQIAYGLASCDILKIAVEELAFMTGTSDTDAGIRYLKSRYPQIKLITVTAGSGGSCAYYDASKTEKAFTEKVFTEKVFVPAFLSADTIDTTGAGDTFCGCVLNSVLEHGLDRLTAKDLQEMLRFANAAGSIATTRHGALNFMPDQAEIEALLRTSRI